MSDLAPLAEGGVAEPLVVHPPDFHVFDKFLVRCKDLPAINVAVCWPLTDVALSGATEAADEGLIVPVLVGPLEQMEALARSLNLDISKYRLINAASESEAATRSVALCRSGECQALMKGSLHTDELIQACLDKDLGLRAGRLISHVFLLDTPAYNRTLLITDAAINIYPTLVDKVDIVQNCINLAHALGIPEPKVALLSAVETVSPKILSTLDAASLCKMADRGQITGGILDGPLAFDTAVSAQAAKIKGLVSSVAGEADILMVPDVESGNMLAKQLEYLGGAQLAGIVVGSRVPIILTSRADSAEARLASTAVAVLLHYASLAAPKA
ncbi:MAG TPA: bifunctional enoyl-CoA hydratase/phosphate acetyltransferase [Acidisarcina sp.]|nr:bifunctional enoyl-CoA hydratase/phosphate acetyltransferase [Acidisarcina sp.]